MIFTVFLSFFLVAVSLQSTTGESTTVNGSMSTTPGPQVVKTKEKEQLLITAVPQDINQLDTEPLTINCTYQPPPCQSQFVVQSLVLTKSDGHVLSSLHVTNPDVPTTPDISVIRPGRVSIKGHLRSTDNLTSYLSVTWDAPTEKEQGTYHCEAIIKEEPFSALHIYRETNVHDTTNLFIKNKIESLDKEMANQKENTSYCRQKMENFKEMLLAHEKRLVQLEKYIKIVHDYWTSFFVSAVFKNRAYLLSKEITEGFSNAEPACGSMGGCLGEIDDEEEWSFIVAFIKEKKIGFTLIGGKDDINEGSWYWSHSRRPVTFTKWAPNQPDNYGNNEDCLEIWYWEGKYLNNDIPCMIKNRDHFLCEIPLFNFS